VNRRRRRRAVPGALALAVAAALASGCKSRKAAPDDHSGRPARLADVERKRGTDACTDYVARLCACAEQHPELQEDCYLARAQPEALALALQVDDDPETSIDTAMRTQAEARKIIAVCIAEAARLPQRGCPR